MEPRLTIVSGDPSPGEIAAVVTALTARLESAGPARVGEATRTGWSSRYRLLREPLSRGPGAWRASALPR